MKALWLISGLFLHDVDLDLMVKSDSGHAKTCMSKFPWHGSAVWVQHWGNMQFVQKQM